MGWAQKADADTAKSGLASASTKDTTTVGEVVIPDSAAKEELSHMAKLVQAHPTAALNLLLVLSLLVLGYLFYTFIFKPAVGKHAAKPEDGEGNDKREYRIAKTDQVDLPDYLKERIEQKSKLVKPPPTDAADDKKSSPITADENSASPRAQTLAAAPSLTPAQPVAPLAAPPQKSAVTKDEFFMTVPNNNETFYVQAKKSTPADCLYKFEVSSDQPNKASFIFFGGESAMKRAQGFRQEQLLPAIEFLNQPNLDTFKIARQEPGLAILDGSVWRIEKKIKIEFQS